MTYRERMYEAEDDNMEVGDLGVRTHIAADIASEADARIAALEAQVAEARKVIERYATAWGARNSREALMAFEADVFGAQARKFLEETK